MLLVDTAESAQVACFHCGEKCDEVLRADEKAFCCVGCQTVYELLRNKDLCGYYDFEERGAISFKQTRNSRFEFLDDETVRPQLIQFSDSTLAKTTLRLPTIHCASCIWLLENLFKINPAILRSEVNFLKKEISLSFREKEIKLSEVASLLAKLGYEPDIRFDNITPTTQSQENARKKLYLKVGLAGFAFGNVMLFSFPDYLDTTKVLSTQFKFLFAWLSILFSTPVLLYSASDYFVSSWYAFRQRKISLDVPIALGISALYFRSVYDIISGAGMGYLDSFNGLVFFLLIGKIFQQKTFDSLSFDRNYASYFPLSVAVLEDGKENYLPVSKLQKGNEIFVRNRELVPADSILLSANAAVDYSFVTGESESVVIKSGDLVYAGGRIVGAGAKLSVVKAVSHSYLTQLWNNEAFHKEKHSTLLDISDAFGKYFTVVVMAIASIAAWYWLPNVDKAINVFTAVLIIACPCALTLAVPFTLGAAVAILGKAKFYLKNVGVVPDLAKVNAIVFDKTGTLTHAGQANVEFIGAPLDASELALVADCAKNSPHPLSRQIVSHLEAQAALPARSEQREAAYVLQGQFSIANNSLSEQSSDVALAGRKQAACAPRGLTSTFREIPNCGIIANINGHEIALGAANWIQEITAEKLSAHNNAPVVHLATDGNYRGYFRTQNSYRAGVTTLLQSLQPERELFLLSGDNDNERENLRPLFSGDNNLAFYQKPEDKLQFVQKLQREGKITAMIGDGLNDAGALQQSNVGIALTEDTSAFTPACDAILAAENFSRLPQYISFARYALKVLVGAFLLSLVYNTIGLALAVTGRLSPMVTAIFMPLSSWSVVALAWGLMKVRERKIVKSDA